MLPSILIASGVIASIIAHFQYAQWKRNLASELSPALKSFQLNYFVVYLLANGADWLQGPYVYALYGQYGFNKDEIAVLFMCGFVSSMIFGTFAGSLADVYGRKRMALAFGVIYGFGCLTKLSSNFWILFLGRFVGGVATSLLFSVFESWMVYEHHRQGFEQSSLNNIFSKSVLLNGLVAILAGFAASLTAKFFGFVAPFMLSFLLLIAQLIFVYANWTENYGNKQVDLLQSLKTAATELVTVPDILVLGIIQSLFEGSMYVFVFLWTPTLSAVSEEFNKPKNVLHGLVFSAFMLAVMLGSSIFGKISSTTSPRRIMTMLLFVAAGALTVPVFFQNAQMSLIAFLLFECCCGVYFPTAASLRSLIIPEQSRSTIMSMFRVGLNILVIVALKFTGSLPTYITFGVCVSWLLIAACCTHFLLHAEPKDTLLPP